MPEHNKKPASVYQTTYEALLKKYQRGNSRLKPQVKGWEEDLPEKKEYKLTAPRAIYINKFDEVSIEIPRHESISWSGMWFALILGISSIVIVIYYLLTTELISIFKKDILSQLLIVIFFSMNYWVLKLLLIYPRGTPVRFNRARQKVYVYEFKRCWNPWARWRAEIKVFDWADIHGEMIRQVGRYDSGYRLSCAVCKPGTFEVVDRFMLSWTVGHPEMLRGLWSFCCHYMQYQPVPERPLIEKHPHSWCPRNNIHWPEAIDRESTTAPQCKNETGI